MAYLLLEQRMISAAIQSEIVNYDEFVSEKHCQNFINDVIGKRLELPPFTTFPKSFDKTFSEIFKQQLNEEELNLLVGAIQGNDNFFSNNNQWRIYNQNWPNPFDKQHPRDMEGELVYAKCHKLITKSTPITSFGSCFASEVAFWLQKNEYNYLIGKNANRGENGMYRYSSDWGNIYNTPSFYQLLTWITNSKQRPFYFYNVNNELYDPFCEEIKITGNDIKGYKDKVNAVYTEAFEIIKNSKVLILTVGLNEVYQFLPTMDYMFRGPKGLNPACYNKKVLTIEENLYFLERSMEMLKSINPELQVIVSVSPVPLIRSFRSDKHVVEATMLSKCTLRIAIEELCNRSDVHYFPSFETAMYPGASSESVFQLDERHVKPKFVEKIMTTFEEMFCVTADDENYKKSFSNHKLSEQEEISVEIALQSFDDLDRDLKLDSTFLAKLKDAFQPNSVRMGMNTELAHVYFRTISVQTGLRLNEIQGKYFAQYGNTFNGNENVKKAVKSIQEKGYFYLSGKNQESLLHAMDAFFDLYPLKSEKTSNLELHKELVNGVRKNLIGDIKHHYDFTNLPFDVIANYCKNLQVPDIAKSVLGHIGVSRILGWTNVATPSEEFDLDKAALKYHFDLDNMAKWLKVFIFLNDVNIDNGPHVFIEGSHKSLKQQFWRDGRFDNNEVDEFYPDASRTFTAKAGDILIVDTIGLHKGMPLKRGHRDLLQLTLAQTAFGKPYCNEEKIFEERLHESLFH